MDVKREGWVTTNGTPKNSAGEHEPSLDERYKNWPLPSKSACQWRAVHEVGRALWRTNAANRTDARRVFHDSKGGGNETSRLVPDVITYTKWVIIEGFRCALVFFRVCRVSNKLNYEPSARNVQRTNISRIYTEIFATVNAGAKWREKREQAVFCWYSCTMWKTTPVWYDVKCKQKIL